MNSFLILIFVGSLGVRLEVMIEGEVKLPYVSKAC